NARRPDRFERALDPESQPTEWGHESARLSPNPGEGRVSLEARSDAFGRAGFGTFRATFADSEVGRYQRALFGPYVDMHLRESEDGKPSTLRAGVKAFFAPGFADPTRGLSSAPGHDELNATGG